MTAAPPFAYVSACCAGSMCVLMSPSDGEARLISAMRAMGELFLSRSRTLSSLGGAAFHRAEWRRAS